MDHAIEKMIIEMQIRGLSEGSQQEYVRCVEVFQLYHGKPVTEVTDDEI